MHTVLVLIKPDVSQDQVTVSEIIEILEAHGRITIQKEVLADRELILNHYNKDDFWKIEHGQRLFDIIVNNGILPPKTALEYGEAILDKIVDYMTSAKVIAIILETDNLDMIRNIIGSTEPTSAAAGTIRNTFSSDSYKEASGQGRAIHNVIHCSDSYKEAAREIELWFNS